MAFSRRETSDKVRQKVLHATETAKSKGKTVAQDCADKKAAWDKEAAKLQRLKSQRDESIANLAKLDQEILSSAEQVAVSNASTWKRLTCSKGAD